MSVLAPPAPLPDSLGQLAGAHARFRAWLAEAALPLWQGIGCDRPALGFVEALTLQGQPADLPYKRMRVQARQIYVFSHAALLGWPGALDAATSAYQFITSQGWRPEGGWACRLGRAGGVLDDQADLYDEAFVLFALAWYARASGSAEALGWAFRTLDWISLAMADPAHGGFHNALPPPDAPRQQNPHMHLLEAVLALHETAGNATTLASAQALVGLFRQHFFHPETATLGEFFAPDWSWAPGPAGTHIEPGHHYEWVWLLAEYQAQTNEPAPEAAALYQFANRHGVDPATGLVWDVVDRQGRLRDGGTRLWTQTEAIKAHLAMRHPGHAARVANGVALLLERFCANCPPGGWIDHFSAEGTSKMEKIPTSSFYHVFMAFGELDRALARAGRPSGFGGASR